MGMKKVVGRKHSYSVFALSELQVYNTGKRKPGNSGRPGTQFLPSKSKYAMMALGMALPTLQNPWLQWGPRWGPKPEFLSTGGFGGVASGWNIC